MRRSLLLFAIFAPYFLHAGNKIKYYFNHPVDNSVSMGVNAVNLNGAIDDTLIAYINRSKYTLDIAVYNFTSTASNVATAINNAYARGVRVRWIYDAAQSNSGLPLLNSGINKLGSPTTSAYTIMHNKFMVVDANSTNPDDAIVWTGSTNWNNQQFTYDFNNVVIIQDSALARAYRAQFNMMWGDTAIAPNTALSKFGQFKTDLGRHNFTIEGKQVELYFSPADGTNSHIQSAINSADVDMYFGMYTFTDNGDAGMLVSKHSSGVYIAGIQDNSSVAPSPSASSTLAAGLGSNFKIYSGSDLYHNKYLIVDPSAKCSDPMVLTGSHNWSFNANTKNDENTLIIHDDTAANIFYQSFRADYTGIGGSLLIKNGCTNSVGYQNISANSVQIFPNPSTGVISISFNVPGSENVHIEIHNAVGQRLISINEQVNSGSHIISCTIETPGLYFAKFKLGEETFTKKFSISGSATH